MTAKEFVSACLREHGLSVERIREADKPRPDLLAWGQKDRFLVEVKEKYPDPELLRKREKRILDEGVYSWSDSLGRQNRLSGVIRQAAKQLATEEAPFRVVWILAQGPDKQLQVDQFFASLYGIATIVDWDEPDEEHCWWDCFYFTNSDFYRYRNSIDGAVLHVPTGARLCINDMSPNYSAFAQCELSQAFGDAVVDPTAWEKTGEIMTVRGDIDRRDETAVLDYLRARYGRKEIVKMPMGQISAAAAFLCRDNS